MKYMRNFLNQIKLVGAKTYCPLCQIRNGGFNSLPDFYKLNAEQHGFVHFGKGEMTAHETYSCAECGASDRERLYAYWLEYFYKIEDKYTSKAVHFAPEVGLSIFLRKLGLFEKYETADLMMSGVTHEIDLMNLPFADGSYDFFICSHVLEHVDDDAAAIRELFRVTRKGGQGILMAPIIVGLSKTIEDPSITDEGERWRLFGQNDHVRLYAHDDYVARIEASGFKVHQFDESYFGNWLFKKLGLKSSSILYVVSKP